MKRVVFVTCLAAILLLSLTASAFADTSGTVYGKAILAPYSIVVSGAGVDAYEPLTYQGSLGQYSPEQYGGEVTVQNTGTQAAEIKADVGSLPSDGNSTWNLSLNPGMDNASWHFYATYPYNHDTFILPTSDPNYDFFSVLVPSLASGDARSFTSAFGFPTASSSSGDHTMSAVISVVAPS
jgi:hypothetical protein